MVEILSFEMINHFQNITKIVKKKTIFRNHMGTAVDFVLLGLLAFAYGGPYALVSKAIAYYKGSVLNAIRMLFAFIGSIIFFLHPLLLLKRLC